MIIDVKDLKSNMLIDEDLYNNQGGLIVPKGFPSTNTAQLMKLLENNGISKIKVLLLPNSGAADENIEEMASSSDNEDKKSFFETNKAFFEDKKEQEVSEFLENFTDSVDSFQKEIQNSVLGKGQKNNIILLLWDNINKDAETETNLFQLLQKLKDSDDYTFLHSSSVALVANKIGQWLQLGEDDLYDLSIAALLSDVGKTSIPKDILSKPSQLTSEEYDKVKKHVEESLKIVESYGFNENIVNSVKYHHERCDGSGYPLGLKYEQIPLNSRIIAIADVFVALTSKRPHRDKMTPFEAVSVLETEYMQKLDIIILSEFVKHIAKSYIGSPVKLSNGQTGKIVFINKLFPLRPIVQIDGENGELIDLSSKENLELKITEFF